MDEVTEWHRSRQRERFNMVYLSSSMKDVVRIVEGMSNSDNLKTGDHKTRVIFYTTPWKDVRERHKTIMDLPLEVRRKIYLNTIDFKATCCPRQYSNLNAFPRRQQDGCPQSLVYFTKNGDSAIARCNTPNILRVNSQIYREYIQELFHHVALQLFISNCPTNEVFCQLRLSDRHIHSLPPTLSIPRFSEECLTKLVLTFSLEQYDMWASTSHIPLMHGFPHACTYRELGQRLNHNNMAIYHQYLSTIYQLKNLRHLDIIVRLGRYLAVPNMTPLEVDDTIARDVGHLFSPIYDAAACPQKNIRLWISFADRTTGILVRQAVRVHPHDPDVVTCWTHIPNLLGQAEHQRLLFGCRTCWWHKNVQMWRSTWRSHLMRMKYIVMEVLAEPIAFVTMLIFGAGLWIFLAYVVLPILKYLLSHIFGV